MGKNHKRDGSNKGQSSVAKPVDMFRLSATAGALAGAVARFVVGPLDVIKIRFQVQIESIGTQASHSKYKSLRQAFKTIVKEEGIQVRSLLTSTYCISNKRAVPPCTALALN